MAVGGGVIRPIADAVLIGLFAVGIGAPMVATISWPRPSVSVAESRALAAPPEFKLEKRALAHFPRRFEAYFNDCFGLRQDLCRTLAAVRVKALHVSSSSQVILGKHGWLFVGGQPFEDDFRHVQRFTDTELARWQAALEARRAWLAERGIAYLVVIVPNKPTIYAENLPAARRPVPTESRLDQLLAWMHARSSVEIVDVRAALLKAKTLEPVYFHKDTHWNDRGAFVGYQHIMQALAVQDSRLQALPRSAFNEMVFEQQQCDLARMLGSPVSATEQEISLRPRQPLPVGKVPLTYTIAGAERNPYPSDAFETGNPALPRAVMFHDSFGLFLRGFLAGHFNRILYAWQNEPTFDVDVIDQERPRIVIQEFAEYKLTHDIAPGVAPASLVVRK